MAFKIVRNDITKMHTEAIVNTANSYVAVGKGCDSAVYEAAGYNKLFAYRLEKIGFVPEGEVFITPGFNLQAKYIIHAVSPLYKGGDQGEEEKLRSCYRKSLQLAREYKIKSISFPLISTGGFGYPKEEGMQIALDEIHKFLLNNEIEVYLVVFDDKSRSLGKNIAPDLKEYINKNYVANKTREEYDYKISRNPHREEFYQNHQPFRSYCSNENTLKERITHISDTFSQYLMYLIKSKNMSEVDVYKRSLVDKRIFSRIRNDINYHPQKITALCFCIGAKLNLDQTKDLLARAGYALSPCNKTDIIFSYFIENEIYDMIELDIQLEECGESPIIS